MPKVNCKFATTQKDHIICTLINDLCGHQKYCQMEGKFVLSSGCFNCTLAKEVNDNEKYLNNKKY